MAICNRDLDNTQQRYLLNVKVLGTPSGISAGILNPVVGTASTFVLANIDRPSQLVVGGIAAYGLSSTPNYQLWLQRFAGGITAIQIGASVAPTAFGTSGLITFSALPASISFPCQSGDQLLLTSTGANTASAELQVTVVLKSLQDILSDFNF